MSNIRLIFEKQWLHLISLIILVPGLAWISNYPGIREGQVWGISTPVWFWCAAGIPIVHQVFVWLCWRIELHGSGLSNFLGKAGFFFYAVSFSVLGLARVAFVFILAYSNQSSLPMQIPGLKFLAVLAMIPAVYLFYSVKRYFGYRRAFGIDHFDTAYRTQDFEKRGIFRFTRNGMYIYGFLILWVPALWWSSLAALTIALFNHLYIWVHYFATERPDMQRIYGKNKLQP